MVTSKHSQVLQNRHFADFFLFCFAGGTKKTFDKKISSETFLSDFSQTACFGGAVNVWTSPSDAPRKFIARHIGFSLLRPLAEGYKGKKLFFSGVLAKKQT